MGLLKESITGSLHKLGALLLKSAFSSLKKKMSYDEYGGAPLLGVNGIVVICHGKSNGKAIANAVRAADVAVGFVADVPCLGRFDFQCPQRMLEYSRVGLVPAEFGGKHHKLEQVIDSSFAEKFAVVAARDERV